MNRRNPVTKGSNAIPRLPSFLLLAVLACSILASASHAALSQGFETSELPTPPISLDRAFKAQLGDTIVIAGGIDANGTPSANVYSLVQDATEWKEIGELPHTWSDGASAVEGTKLILIGGRIDGQATAKILRLSVSGSDGIQTKNLPDLPQALLHPAAIVNTLLESWAQYLESPQYLQEKTRAQKLNETNAEAVNEKHRQVQLKMKVHRLRHQVRQAKALHRNQRAITKDNHKMYKKWLSGEISQELHECTQANGYGKLESTGEMLQSAGCRGPQRQWR